MPPAESDVLERVTVRLLAENERPEFDRLLREEPHLHRSVLVGQSLGYVAEVDLPASRGQAGGQWLALLTFSAPALHLKARERWRGRSPRQRARRLDADGRVWLSGLREHRPKVHPAQLRALGCQRDEDDERDYPNPA